MKLNEALAEIMLTVRDQAGKLAEGPDSDVSDTPDAFRTALTRGLSRYSQIKPRRVTSRVACGANGRILLSSIANFSESFRHLLRIEYPIIEVGAPQWLDGDEWILDQDDDGDSPVDYIRFLWSVPPAGAVVRIAHFCEHVLPSGDTFTVPGTDMPAVVHFSASAALTMLANEYAQSSETTIASAQIANFINKSGIYASRARDEETRAIRFLRTQRLGTEVSLKCL